MIIMLSFIYTKAVLEVYYIKLCHCAENKYRHYRGLAEMMFKTFMQWFYYI